VTTVPTDIAIAQAALALAGDILTIPGRSKTPAAEKIRVHPDGSIEGLF